jgi:hypothetical protein
MAITVTALAPQTLAGLGGIIAENDIIAGPVGCFGGAIQ